jgi:hypothetical protein
MIEYFKTIETSLNPKVNKSVILSFFDNKRLKSFRKSLKFRFVSIILNHFNNLYHFLSKNTSGTLHGISLSRIILDDENKKRRAAACKLPGEIGEVHRKVTGGYC